MSMTSAGCKYASAGAVFADDVRFHVKDRAYLPDSDAGTDLAGCYRAGHKARPKARRYDVPMRLVIILTAVVVFACAISVLTRVYQMRSLEDQIASMRSQMAQTEAANVQLQKEVEKIRDLSRIGYIAVHELGMVACDDSNMIRMYVPAVEYFSGTVDAPEIVVEQETPAFNAGMASASR